MSLRNNFQASETLLLLDSNRERSSKINFSLSKLVKYFSLVVIGVALAAGILMKSTIFMQSLEVRIFKINSKTNIKKTKAKPGCRVSIILIRHCEKQSLVDRSKEARQNCNLVGFQRAQFLPTLFGDDKEKRWPNPSYLYAESPHRRYNFNNREIQTLQPLSNATNVKIISSYRKKEGHHKMAKHILKQIRNGDLCSKLVLICWNHHNIPKIARHLGCSPYNGCPIRFKGNYDSAWEINFAYRPNTTQTGWQVFGTVTTLGFDPLQYEKKLGYF